MCGICGQLSWGTGAAISTALLEKMNLALFHRGPDDHGMFTTLFSGAGGMPGAVGLAMRRLAVIDLVTGKQPIANETGDVVAVYNGETYNFQDLRSELAARGHRFRTAADSEVIVHGYEEWGLDMPARLNGMFAFALWDGKRQRLVLARDRMGIKPLYYAMLENRLVFGSEIKALLVDPAVPRDIDPLAVDDYLSHRYIPTPRSVYKAIRKLEPATLLVWENGQTTFQRYWDFSPADGPDRGEGYYLEQVDALLADAVRRQMVSDVPLGTFLSGGLDSPTITYYARKINPDLLSFNIFFSEKSFSERREAALVARHLGTRHMEEEVSPHVQSLIPRLVDVFDEPFGDDSMVPTFFLTRLARQHMTVALSGDGGDEVFGGYPTYIADRFAEHYRALPRFMTRWMIEPVARRLPVSFSRISWDYKVKAFVHAARRPSPLEHFGWTEIFRPEEKARLYAPAFWEAVKMRNAAENFTAAWDGAGARKGLERFLYVDQRTHLLDEFLVKVDRLSMAHSLEVRPPFLDHRLVEFAAGIPFRHKLRGMTTKYLIRRLMRDRLPPQIIRGAKKGFSPPTAMWLARDLEAYARRKFSPSHLASVPFLNPDEPGRLFEMHLARKANMGRRLWTLLMLIAWYDRTVLGRE